MKDDYLSQIDFCIKTYLRPQACENLIASILRFYPGAAITTNDDPCIAKGRNELVKRTKRPFLLFLDDDFEFTENTKRNNVGRLLNALANRETGIAAGSVIDCINGKRIPRNSGGRMTFRDGTIRLDAAPDEMYVDVAPNFFLARREVVQTCKWRWGIGAEHLDFFMQVKDAGWQVFNAKAVTIDHHPLGPESRASAYRQARWNIAANVLAFMNHWGIDRVLVNGKVAHTRLPIDAIRNDASGFACHPVGRSPGV